MPIRTAEQNGVWWLLSERGAPFVSIGVNHLQPDCWLAPYNRQFMLDRYGSDLATRDGRFNAEGEALPRLVQATKRRLADLGFNTFGIHTYDVPAWMFADEFFYCVAVEALPLGSQFRFGEQSFPDIFAPAFEELLDTQVRAVCAEHGHNDRLVGYAFSDIPRWYFYQGERSGALELHPWIIDLLQLPDSAPGKQACLDACRVTNASDVKTRHQSDSIMEALVARWYALHVELIRKYDTDHLILGDKLHSPHRIPDWFLPILRDHVDILFVQWYSPFESQRDTLRSLHQTTGKPIINGDSSFACVKPPKQTQVKGYKVDSQSEVGKAYHDYLRNVMSLPFMLGWHHCGLVEQWDGGKTVDWAVNENGLFDPFENPYPEITVPAKAANERAHHWHTLSAT